MNVARGFPSSWPVEELEHFNIEMGMIDMGDLEGTTAMPGRTVLHSGSRHFFLCVVEAVLR